ncbi:hypothetical protein DEO72_LG6g719 [Vigna unguiculata]|uniref:Uncharacterized protein n=1 Tax=Vigna unguiculata TaxID=3917 RepID=A0A4D6M5A7_VIGUN|nr:hypothetical protein DEO72_LG6g719 [Vigna unguiculata]
MADEYEELLSCGSGWQVLRVQIECPPQCLADEFGSLGTLRTNYVRIGNSTWRYIVWSVIGFPHVFYKLWLVGGGSKGYLEVTI